MRHTPLDGPDAGRRHGGTQTEGEPEDDSRGFLGRLRAALERVGNAVRQFVETDSGQDSVDLPEVADRGEPTDFLVDREHDGEKPVVVDRNDEGREPTAVRRGPPDRPELVARWHDGQLTLSEPDERGAEISSDVWSEVDP